jgi:hypothetical protein
MLAINPYAGHPCIRCERTAKTKPNQNNYIRSFSFAVTF